MCCESDVAIEKAFDTRTFVTPYVNTKTFGEKSFSYAGPSVWNSLPQTLHHSDSTSSFKAAIRRTCLRIIFKLFFTALPIPSSDTVCVCACVCVRVCVCVCACVCVCVCVCVC